MGAKRTGDSGGLRMTPLAMVLAGVAALLLIGVVMLWTGGEKPPPPNPEEVTKARLESLRSALAEYVVTNKKVPAGIGEFAGAIGTSDGWNRPIEYSAKVQGSGSGTGRMGSLGPDGQGGTDDDLAYTLRFGLDGYRQLSLESAVFVRGK